jgi:transcriptional regulator with XRE-family HTH domain
MGQEAPQVWAAETVDERLTIIRRRSGLSQSDLSTKLGEMGVPIDRSMVARFENGTRRPSFGHLWAIAKILGVTVFDLGATPEEYPELRFIRDPEMQQPIKDKLRARPDLRVRRHLTPVTV